MNPDAETAVKAAVAPAAASGWDRRHSNGTGINASTGSQYTGSPAVIPRPRFAAASATTSTTSTVRNGASADPGFTR